MRRYNRVSPFRACPDEGGGEFMLSFLIFFFHFTKPLLLSGSPFGLYVEHAASGIITNDDGHVYRHFSSSSFYFTQWNNSAHRIRIHCIPLLTCDFSVYLPRPIHGPFLVFVFVYRPSGDFELPAVRDLIQRNTQGGRETSRRAENLSRSTFSENLETCKTVNIRDSRFDDCVNTPRKYVLGIVSI